MALSNAQRQAAYRARKRGEVAPEPLDPPLARALVRILELEEEVRHLKAELAKRPLPHVPPASPVNPYREMVRQHERFNTRPFTPVPKSRSRSTTSGHGA